MMLLRVGLHSDQSSSGLLEVDFQGLDSQIVSKVKLVLSSFACTADIPRGALSPVKRPTRTVRST